MERTYSPNISTAILGSVDTVSDCPVFAYGYVPFAYCVCLCMQVGEDWEGKPDAIKRRLGELITSGQG